MTEKPYIILVEDEEAHSELALRSFELIGSAELKVCDTLGKAHSAIRERQPDLVIIDWRLPDGQGIDLLKQYQKADFPMVIMTSFGSEKLAVEAMKSGALDYIVKSDVSLRDLPHIAERAIREWQNLQKIETAEKQLEASEESFKIMFRNAGIGMAVADSDFYFTEVNETLCKILGYTESEMLGKNIAEVITADAVREFVEAVGVLRDHKVKTISINTQLRGNSQRKIWAILSCSMPWDVGSRDSFINIQIQDITPLKESEKALMDSEEKFRLISEQSLLGIQIIQDGVIKYANNAYSEICGYSTEEIYSWEPWEFLKLIDSEMRDYVKEQIEKKALSGSQEISHYECKGYKKDGSVLWIDQYSKSINYHNAPADLVTIIDINKRKRSEILESVLYEISNASIVSRDIKELYESIRFQLGKLIDTTNFFIAIYDKESDECLLPYFKDNKDDFEKFPIGKTGTSWVINNAKPLLMDEAKMQQMTDEGVLEYFGSPSKIWLGVPLLKSNEVIGAVVVQNYEDKNAYTEEDLKILQFVSNQIALAIDRKLHEEEIGRLNRDLEQLVIDRTAQLENTLEKLTYENYERKKTEEKLYKAQEEIKNALAKERELHELKSKFISIVSHEYRTPLTIILSSTYLMEEYFNSQKKNEFFKQLEKIRASVNNMTSLLENILELGRSENAQKDLDFEKIDIAALAELIIEEVETIDKQRHKVVFNHELEDKYLYSDKKLLQQILGNLLNNAVKYSQTNSDVVFNLISNKENIIFEIIDSGIGIPEADQKHLFKPFHRSTNTEGYKGTGLGLSIVKNNVETLGGSIKVVSALNRGSSFTVVLPLIHQN